MSTHTEHYTSVQTPASTEETQEQVDENYPNQVSTKEVTTKASGSSLAVNIIWYITGILELLLGFRFVLALLGANPANGFADFIYTVSHPFVQPFFGLFDYHTTYGVSRFEGYTLVAMAVYAVLAWLITKAFTLNRPRA